MNKYETNVREDRPASRRASPYSDTPQEFLVTYTPIKSGVFNIYLFGVIEEASQFISAIEVMSAATELDEVHIHLSTDGGSMNATDTFLSAMAGCEAKVVCHSSGGTHSAGTIILLNADEFSLSENANFLIHNGAAGAGGKFSDFRAQSKHSVDYMEKVLRKTYKHFLSDDELDALVDGKDFWLNAEEFAMRYEMRNTALMEEYEARSLPPPPREQKATMEAALAESSKFSSADKPMVKAKKPRRAVAK